ncbi:unnamed protein product, partial [Strongylus vulgaris]
RNGCDQYGSPCSVLLSSARRKPIIAPIGNITETPLFFNVAKERRCVSNATEVDFDPDSTCLPNEKCINGECRMYVGNCGPASMDVQAMKSAPHVALTLIVKKRKVTKMSHNASVATDNFFLDDAVISQCPQGFHESGAYCMHDDEDAFWTDGDAQDRIKALLNASPC